MSQYTTGEMAKLCGITVRAVQFYDTRGLLKPTSHSQGGRRLYTDDDLQKLRLICLLKSLGLALDAIRGILESDAPQNVLLLLLDEQEKALQTEIKDRQRRLQVLQAVREGIRSSGAIPVQTLGDMERLMNRKKTVGRVHGAMVAVGVVMDGILLSTALLWALRGYRAVFFAGIPVVVLLGILLARMYRRNTAYICAACNAAFSPSMGEMLFSRHTPKTRKLRCPGCGHRGYCVEVARRD